MNDNFLLAHIDAQVALLKNNLPTPSKDLRVCVTVPAKNEQHYLLHTLNALVSQKDREGKLLNLELFEVLVLCHNCTDATYENALKFRNENPGFNLHVLRLDSEIIDNIGGARRVLMHISAERLSMDDAWIVTTDADTIPNADWIYTLMNQPNSIDMVCGKININTVNLGKNAENLLMAKDHYNLLKTQLEYAIVPDVRDPWPRHYHHSGPNMALRRHVYLAVNGIPPIGFLEDIHLYHRVKASGYAIRHTNDWVVETSGRLFSKMACGLGSELNYWSTKEVKYCVEDLTTLRTRFTIYKRIKELFEDFEPCLLDDISELSMINKSQVEQIYTQSSIYEEMILKIEEVLDTDINWRETYPIRDIFIVNKELENYIKSISLPSFAKA